MTNIKSVTTPYKTVQFQSKGSSVKANAESVTAAPLFSGDNASSPVTSMALARALKSQVKFAGEQLKESDLSVLELRNGEPFWTAKSWKPSSHGGAEPRNGILPSIMRKMDGKYVRLDPYTIAFENQIVYFLDDFNSGSAADFNAQIDNLKNKIWDARKEALQGSGVSEADIPAQLNLLQADPEKLKEFDAEKNINNTVTIVIDSPGGAIYSLYSMMDALNALKKQGVTVRMLDRGMAASCGSLLFSQGTPGHRLVTPHSVVMIHQPLGMYPYSQATDLNIRNNVIQKMKEYLTRALADAALDGQIVRREKAVKKLESQLAALPAASTEEGSPSLPVMTKDGAGVGMNPEREKLQRELNNVTMEMTQFKNQKDRLGRWGEAVKQVDAMILKSEELDGRNMTKRAELTRRRAKQLIETTKDTLEREALKDEKLRLEAQIVYLTATNGDPEELEILHEELSTVDTRSIAFSNMLMQMAQMCERDRYLTAEQSVEIGLADAIATE